MRTAKSEQGQLPQLPFRLDGRTHYPPKLTPLLSPPLHPSVALDQTFAHATYVRQLAISCTIIGMETQLRLRG